MKIEKILKIIIALLSVFVIAAGIFIIVGQPENGIITEETEQETPGREMPQRQKPVTSARDENAEIDLSEFWDAIAKDDPKQILDGQNDDDRDHNYPRGLVIMHSAFSQIEDDIDKYYPVDKPFPYEFFIQYKEEGTNYFKDELALDILEEDPESFDQNVDLLILEPDFAYDLINSDYIMPLSELGFTKEELSDQFPFTVSLTSDENGVQKGLMYRLNPEVLVYRKSIAKEVLGTDDPSAVAEYVKDRESFDATAEKMKQNGYKMLGSTTDELLMFTQHDSTPISLENGECVIPESWKNWAEYTKNYADKGYVINTPRYSDEWLAIYESNEIFAEFYGQISAESLMEYNSEIADDLAFCPGPVGSYDDFNYFGTNYIICATRFTDDPEICADIMRTLALDKETLKSMALNEKVLTNTVSVMTAIGNDAYSDDFGGSYNPFYAYTEAAKKIGDVKSKSSLYEWVLDLYVDRMENYFNGKSTYDECVTLFQEDVNRQWHFYELNGYVN
jgi:hypothetical protein